MDTLSGAMKWQAGSGFSFRRHSVDSGWLMVIFYLDSSIEEAKWLTREEKTLLAQNLQAEDKHKTEHKLSDLHQREGVGAVRDLFHFDDRLVRHRVLAADDCEGICMKGYLELA